MKAYGQSRWQGGRTQGNSMSIISSCNTSGCSDSYLFCFRIHWTERDRKVAGLLGDFYSLRASCVSLS